MSKYFKFALIIILRCKGNLFRMCARTGLNMREKKLSRQTSNCGWYNMLSNVRKCSASHGSFLGIWHSIGFSLVPVFCFLGWLGLPLNYLLVPQLFTQGLNLLFKKTFFPIFMEDIFCCLGSKESLLPRISNI